MTQVSAKVSVSHYWSFGITYFLCSPAQLHSTDGTMINTLKQVGKAVLKKVAPKTFWSMRLSALRQRFPEEELYIVPSLCDKSKMSIDIGADRGVYTAHFIGLSRECLAFEPRPQNASIIEQMGAQLSLPIRVETVALSDTVGEVKLRILANDQGRSTIEDNNTLDDLDGSPRFEIAVPTRRLDDYKLDAVGFIKIDVEGHELAVLRGASATIQRCHPSMLIEIEERHKLNSTRHVYNFLAGFDYEGYFLLDGNLISMTDFNVEKYQDSKNIGGWKDNWKRTGVYVNNFFFILPENRSRLQSGADRLKNSLSVQAA